MLPVLLIVIPYAMMRIGKNAGRWQTEAKDISELKELPQFMEFFYSKWSVIFNVSTLSVVTGVLFVLNTAFIWAPQKHASDFGAGILVELICLPFTIFFGIKSYKSISTLMNIGKPAATLSRTGCQHGNLIFPWPSIEKITTTGLRTPFLIVLFKRETDGKIEKSVLNLSLVKNHHLPEYMEAYMSAYGDSQGKWPR